MGEQKHKASDEVEGLRCELGGAQPCGVEDGDLRMCVYAHVHVPCGMCKHLSLWLASMRVHACACVCMYVHVCACMRMRVQVCDCVCMYVHACAAFVCSLRKLGRRHLRKLELVVGVDGLGDGVKGAREASDHLSK